MKGPFLGLRTAIYPVADLARAKKWYASVLGFGPYFDQPFYVGFEVGGYELGLDPDTTRIGPGTAGATAYWGVPDVGAAWRRLIGHSARPYLAIQETGGGIKVAAVLDPFGNVFGIIENPHFRGEGTVAPGKPAVSEKRKSTSQKEGRKRVPPRTPAKSRSRAAKRRP